MYQVFLGFEWYKPWRYMKNHQKPSLKPFLGPENRYLDHLWDIIFILEKVRFPPYPAVLKREYLELGIEFWHSVKSADFVLKSSFIWIQHVFLPYTPYRLKTKIWPFFGQNWLFWEFLTYNFQTQLWIFLIFGMELLWILTLSGEPIILCLVGMETTLMVSFDKIIVYMPGKF